MSTAKQAALFSDGDPQVTTIEPGLVLVLTPTGLSPGDYHKDMFVEAGSPFYRMCALLNHSGAIKRDVMASYDMNVMRRRVLDAKIRLMRAKARRLNVDADTPAGIYAMDVFDYRTMSRDAMVDAQQQKKVIAMLSAGTPKNSPLMDSGRKTAGQNAEKKKKGDGGKKKKNKKAHQLQMQRSQKDAEEGAIKHQKPGGGGEDGHDDDDEQEDLYGLEDDGDDTRESEYDYAVEAALEDFDRIALAESDGGVAPLDEYADEDQLEFEATSAEVAALMLDQPYLTNERLSTLRARRDRLQRITEELVISIEPNDIPPSPHAAGEHAGAQAQECWFRITANGCELLELYNIYKHARGLDGSILSMLNAKISRDDAHSNDDDDTARALKEMIDHIKQRFPMVVRRTVLTDALARECDLLCKAVLHDSMPAPPSANGDNTNDQRHKSNSNSNSNNRGNLLAVRQAEKLVAMINELRTCEKELVEFSLDDAFAAPSTASAAPTAQSPPEQQQQATPVRSDSRSYDDDGYHYTPLLQ